MNFKSSIEYPFELSKVYSAKRQDKLKDKTETKRTSVQNRSKSRCSGMVSIPCLARDTRREIQVNGKD